MATRQTATFQSKLLVNRCRYSLELTIDCL